MGTGSGYQAAVLAEIAARVYFIEIVAALAEEARARLARFGYATVEVRAGDGYLGWPEKAPFDAIMVTAAAPRIPQPLKEQLRDGGRLILPVGDESQELIVVTPPGSGVRGTSCPARALRSDDRQGPAVGGGLEELGLASSAAATTATGRRAIFRRAL